MRSWRCVLHAHTHTRRVVSTILRGRACGKGDGKQETGDGDAPGEEVAEVDELAVPLVLDVDHAPAVLAAADGLAVDDDGALGAHDGEGDHVLYCGVT